MIIQPKLFNWSSPECPNGKNVAGRILNQATGVATYETGN